MNIDSRRSARVLKLGESNGVILTKEFELLNIKPDDEVLVTVSEGRIEIAPKDYYLEKTRKEAKKG